MNFKMIDAILESIVNHDTGFCDPDFLHLKGAKNSTSNFYEKMKNHGISFPEDIDDALVAVEKEYERQGFISGFRMGARMMLECIGPAPLEAWDPNETGNWLSRTK